MAEINTVWFMYPSALKRVNLVMTKQNCNHIVCPISANKWKYLYLLLENIKAKRKRFDGCYKNKKF